ncbi:Per1-like protein [Ephemerocybe angulata]|uniref:Post-GPI attachment to proteins factor 3 n=1 Tax=Ephemerocybe angulata TaxID=980116 RepID=A0A8H6I5D2_9AGAR|nr:Per1-like protein [Tulosesus angulatus]
MFSTTNTRIAALVVVLFISTVVHASSGDRAIEFVRCVSSCTTQRCDEFEATKPLALQLTRWTCPDDCKYNCMHNITDHAVTDGRAIHQYYGKWPFWRYAGMQEPASVIFSLANLWAHLVGFKQVRRKLSDSHPMKKLYLLWSVCSMNAWLWSAIFHTRDTPITEKLDYFSAGLAILNALYYTVIRLFHLYQPARPKLTSGTSISKPLTLLFIGIYAAHIYYLTSGPRFDYTYNTIFNLTLGVLHNLLWTLYALPSGLSLLRSRFPGRPREYRPSFASKAGLFVALTTAATALEVFDFPPWGRVLDAHALWHAATAPIAYFWYQFLVQDALDQSWREPLLREHRT